MPRTVSYCGRDDGPSGNCDQTSQTRREHADEVRGGMARDSTQTAMIHNGMTLPEVEVVDDRPHPNERDPSTGELRVVPGNASDVRLVCGCGYVGPWRVA